MASVSVLALMVGGGVAYYGGWRCRFDNDRAGAFGHPAAGIVALVYYLGFTSLAVTSGVDPFTMIGIVVVLGLLYAPLLAYHAAEALQSTFSTASAPPPDPEDPFERAKAAEERGDSRSAVERYEWVLENEPIHFDARARLADLLARAGRLERAKEVLDKGLALPNAEGWMRFKWRELRQRIEERVLGEEKSEGDRPTFKALGEVRATRLKAWESRPTSDGDGGNSGGNDDGPLDASSLEDEPR